MTEMEWLICADPKPMLEFLRDKASDRKLRLFGVACCRHLWHLFPDERCRNAVLITEQYADGTIRSDVLDTACLGACDAFQDAHEDDRYEYPSADIASLLACPKSSDEEHPTAFDPAIVSTQTVDLSACEASYAAGEDKDGTGYNDGMVAERIAHCQFLRDIFGNPFRPVQFAPSWLTSTVLALAAGIYEERAFDRIPILADALQDAGCDNDDILNHCRQPGEHVKGCWVVDLVLGKE